MADMLRTLTPLDRLLSVLDQGLRTSWAVPSAVGGTGRRAPRRTGGPPPAPLDPAAVRTAASLMRVNHAGEVAAQALYHGQALVARSESTREMLLAAARSESDHLAWGGTP